MFSLTTERADDGPAIESLLDRAFGPDRTAKISYRYRHAAPPIPYLSVVARDAGGAVVGTIRYWPVIIAPAGTPALLLGPVAVEPHLRGQGLAAALIRQTLDMAAWARHRIVLLVGDLAYYGKFGFAPATAHGLTMPDERPERLLVQALAPGALSDVAGILQPWRSVRGESPVPGLVAGRRLTPIKRALAEAGSRTARPPGTRRARASRSGTG